MDRGVTRHLRALGDCSSPGSISGCVAGVVVAVELAVQLLLFLWLTFCPHPTLVPEAGAPVTLLHYGVTEGQQRSL